MANNLVVDDSFIRSQTGEICSDLKNLDRILNTYINCLNSIHADVVKEGATADALEVFTEYASRLKGELKTLYTVLGSLSDSYLINIDKADSYLF